MIVGADVHDLKGSLKHFIPNLSGKKQGTSTLNTDLDRPFEKALGPRQLVGMWTCSYS